MIDTPKVATPAAPAQAESREVVHMRRELARADKDSKRWAERAGQASRDGVTRARMTTINANWSDAARRRDEIKAQLSAALSSARGGDRG